MNKQVRDTIIKWYNTLVFPEKYDGEFYSALDSYDIPYGVSFEDYDLECKDGKKNLLHFLYFSEALAERYKEKGIPEKILTDTLYDIVIWTEKYSAIHGEMYLGELGWLKHSMEMKLFRLGSLEFCLAPTSNSIPSHGVAPGDNVLHIHIPTGASLKPEDTKSSLRAAIDFCKKYYPGFDYKCFICYSWMLDSKLTELLPDSSNILKFRSLFDIIFETPNTSAIRFIFGWDTTEENLGDRIPTSSLAKKIKDAVICGEEIHVALGAIRTEDVLNIPL